MATRTSGLALGLAAGLAVTAGLAAPGEAALFTGSAIGTWQNLQGAAGAVDTITNGDAGGLAVFDFGVAVPGSTTNRFTFDGIGSDGGAGFSTAAETPFVVGHFTYRNGTTAAGSFPQTGGAIDLGINLTLTSPISSVSSFLYDFTIELTPNTTGNPVTDGDIVSILNTQTTTTFVVAGTQYTLALTGFSTNGGSSFTSQFNSPENSTANADIYGTITTQVLGVPEPASLALLGGGLTLMGVLRRRRRA